MELATVPYYVNRTTGGDSKNGLTALTPWKSITHASLTMPANSVLNVQGDFLYESSGAQLAPAANNVKWMNWITAHTRIMFDVASGLIDACVSGFLTERGVNVNGDTPTLPVQTDYHALVQFDISRYTRPVSNAVFRIKCVGLSLPNTRMTLWRLTSTFDEHTVTWNTRPTSTSSGKINGYVFGGFWVEYNVTALVNASTDPTFGVMLTQTDEGVFGIVLAAKESGEGPELVIDQ